MADTTTSGEADGTPAVGTDIVRIARGGSNFRLTTQQIADLHNDAVDTVNGQTGTVVLGAGDVGAAATAFSTVAVSGQSDVVADSTADTLTFVAGTGIAITTVAGTDSITVTNNAPSVPSDFQPAIVTNNYYTGPLLVPVSAPATPSDGDLVAFPIWFSSAETWTRICANVVTGTGGATEKIRLGIWANAAGNVPGALVVDSGELSLQTAGEISATISEALTSNTLYWVGFSSNNNAVCDMTAMQQALTPITWLIGYNATLGGTLADISGLSTCYGYYKGVTYGALPDPFGTPDSYAYDPFPAIWLRKV